MACSNNSRNGIFDLPITPGEELEVIDITEENLVICRNSKGKCKLLAYHPQNFKQFFKKISKNHLYNFQISNNDFCFYRWVRAN